jgi:hypothetical protein
MMHGLGELLVIPVSLATPRELISGQILHANDLVLLSDLVHLGVEQCLPRFVVWRLVVGALPASEVSALVFTGTAQTRVMRADVTVRAMAIVAFASVWKLIMEGVVLLVRHQP